MIYSFSSSSVELSALDILHDANSNFPVSSALVQQGNGGLVSPLLTIF